LTLRPSANQALEARVLADAAQAVTSLTPA
jgi:hypothetical protein